MTLVSGRVNEHSGTGVPGVFVSARPIGGRRFTVAPSTHTNLSGQWELDLSPGQWQVRETGYSAFDLIVGHAAIDTSSESEPQTKTAPDPTPDDIARFLARREQALESRRPVPDLVPDDIARFLARRQTSGEQ